MSSAMFLGVVGGVEGGVEFGVEFGEFLGEVFGGVGCLFSGGVELSASTFKFKESILLGERLTVLEGFLPRLFVFPGLD